jgi:hypothetical protein
MNIKSNITFLAILNCGLLTIKVPIQPQLIIPFIIKIIFRIKKIHSVHTMPAYMILFSCQFLKMAAEIKISRIIKNDIIHFVFLNPKLKMSDSSIVVLSKSIIFKTADTRNVKIKTYLKIFLI